MHALQVDGRAPLRRIGDVLGVSDQTVARRYARLRATNALRVVGLRDDEPSEQVQWVVRARASPGAATDIAGALARRPDTSWIDLCSGGTEIVAAASGPVEALLLDALAHAREVTDVTAERVLHTFYGGARQAFTKPGPLDAAAVAALTAHLPGPADRAHRLDALDERLLTLLRTDGRASMPELSTHTGAAAATVRRRVHDLRAAGVLRLDVDVDFGVLELPVRTLAWFVVDPGHLDQAGQALAGHDEVAFAAAVTGRTNLFATVLTSEPAGVYHYLTTSGAALPGVVAVQTTSVLRHVKDAVRHQGGRARPPRRSAAAP